MINLNASPDKLRKSLLQEAMQGKLTQQLSEDGDAADLLQSIAEEKQQLIQTGKIKKSKQLAAITDDEIPFKIPDNWQWVKLGNIINLKIGKTPSRHNPEYWNGNIPWVSVKDMNNGILNSTNERITEKAANEKFKNKIVPKGTMLMSFKLSIGKVCILGQPAYHNEAIISLNFYKYEKDMKQYLFRIIKFLTKFAKSKNAIEGQTLNKTSLSNMLIPLPPLAEQKRIVAKLDDLLPKVNSFKQSVDHIQTLRNELPLRLRRSFLQEAMQGKLTQQLPEDGDAADLLQSIAEEKQQLIQAGKIKKPKQLAAITDDEIPFKIPYNWKWAKIGNLILYDIGGNTPSKANPDNWNKCGIPWLSVKDINNGYVNDSIDHISIEASKSTARMIPSNSFVAVTRMAVGKFTINTEPMAINQDLRALIMDNNIMNYIQLIYPILQFKTKGATVKGITKKELLNTIIPLPPFKEQKRIINKLKALLYKIDKI